MWKTIALARSDQGLMMSRSTILNKVLETAAQGYTFSQDMRDCLRKKCVIFEKKEASNPSQFAEELAYHQREIECVKERYEEGYMAID